MILVADSGSTKTQWIVIDGASTDSSLLTSGLNPATMPAELITASITRELLPCISGKPIEKIFFYGAGCRGSAAMTMHDILVATTGCTEVDVQTDMTGAARALCGRTPGIVCILGTGSNSCFYDGSEIVANIPPLGFILGDEGSGAVLGRRLLGDIFKGLLPDNVTAAFHSAYPDLTLDSVITRVYRTPEPNKYMASFVPFIAGNIDNPAIERIVTDGFESFFHRNILSYPQARNTPCHFTGSLSAIFRPQLEKVASDCGCTIGRISATPIEGLIEYHLVTA